MFTITEKIKNIFNSYKNNSILIQIVSYQFKHNKITLIKAIKKNEHRLKYASSQLKEDKEIVSTAIENNIKNFEKYHFFQCRYNRQLYNQPALTYNWLSPYILSKNIKNDKQFMLPIIKKNGLYIQYVSENLKNNREVVLEAVSNNGNALQYANKQLRNDKQIALTAVINETDALQYISPFFFNDKEIIQSAFNNNTKQYTDKQLYHKAMFFKYVGYNLQHDKDFIFNIIKQNYHIFKYINKVFQNDKHFVLKLLENNCPITQYLNNQLKDDNDIALLSVKINVDTFTLDYRCKYPYLSLSKKQQYKEKIINIAIRQNPLLYSKLPYIIFYNKQLALNTIKNLNISLLSIPFLLRFNKEIVETALNNNGNNLEYLPYFMKKDKDIVLEACRQNPKSIQFAHKSIQNEIGTNNPVHYIESKTLFTKLDNLIPQKQDVKVTKRKKI